MERYGGDSGGGLQGACHNLIALWPSDENIRLPELLLHCLLPTARHPPSQPRRYLCPPPSLPPHAHPLHPTPCSLCARWHAWLLMRRATKRPCSALRTA